jgi:hypothetical protein
MERTLTDADVHAISEQLKNAHPCRFDDNEAKAVHRFAQVLENGGWQKLEAVLQFGGMLIEFRSTGRKVTVTALVLAILGIVAKGFWQFMRERVGG